MLSLSPIDFLTFSLRLQDCQWFRIWSEKLADKAEETKPEGLIALWILLDSIPCLGQSVPPASELANDFSRLSRCSIPYPLGILSRSCSLHLYRLEAAINLLGPQWLLLTCYHLEGKSQSLDKLELSDFSFQLNEFVLHLHLLADCCCIDGGSSYGCALQ
ncbi:uncharacterized protein LOC131300669 [Rhododendron vialii]|uniref:uncharacterized protein LOC131300669 n=1 Tax=Rhododendron vialii TaxID=182163 RepID=UPI00265F9A91|nr:uncharacterized protein LOC131300669 [Rhododendron vialii]